MSQWLFVKKSGAVYFILSMYVDLIRQSTCGSANVVSVLTLYISIIVFNGALCLCVRVVEPHHANKMVMTDKNK